MMSLPANDPALAHRFATYEAADEMANKLQVDDPEWTYGVEKNGNAFLLKVFDEDGELLGYL